MRAMILAAGLGERMQPLSALCPKPALPIRGVPLIAYLFELLAANGVEAVIVNLHHRADRMREAAERCCPKNLELHFSEETQLLGTGGGILQAADFLRDSDPALVIAGDMLLDADLAGFAKRHRESGDAATLLLRSDPRSPEFGSIGIDAEDAVRRIGSDFDLGGSTRQGLFVGVRAFAPHCFDTLPARDDAFEDLRDWLAPRLRAGARDIRGELCSAGAVGWEPVGTPSEYLRANLDLAPRFVHDHPHPLSAGTQVSRNLVVGRGATFEPGARLERAVVWDGETVPAGLHASDGIFAGGRFVADCGATTNTGLAELGIERDEIDAIVVSHFHADHFGGVPLFLLAARYVDERCKPLLVAGPPDVEKRVRSLAAAMGHPMEEQLGFDVLFRELPPGRTHEIGPARVEAFETQHQLESHPHGYRIDCGGQLLAYSGDTGWFPELPRRVAGADLFICECTQHAANLDFHLSLEELAFHRDEFDCGRHVLTHLGVEMSELRGHIDFETADDGLTIKL